MTEEIKLGMEVKDKISGLQGIVTSVTEFLYGCKRLGVSPQALDEKGKPFEEAIIDEPQLNIIGNGIREEEPLPEPIKKKRNYGDRNFIPTKHQINLSK